MLIAAWSLVLLLLKVALPIYIIVLFYKKLSSIEQKIASVERRLNEIDDLELKTISTQLNDVANRLEK